jgi:hypothetical protein
LPLNYGQRALTCLFPLLDPRVSPRPVERSTPLTMPEQTYSIPP